jgi:TPR repeat protein
LDGLDAAASKGNALAHYALALIYAPGDEDDQDAGSSYWYSQGQQGRVLTGVEKEWAEAYESRLAHAEKYAHHLKEAGRLGHQDALLDLAERFDDLSFFEQPRHGVDGARNGQERVERGPERLPQEPSNTRELAQTDKKSPN